MVQCGAGQRTYAPLTTDSLPRHPCVPNRHQDATVAETTHLAYMVASTIWSVVCRDMQKSAVAVPHGLLLHGARQSTPDVPLDVLLFNPHPRSSVLRPDHASSPSPRPNTLFRAGLLAPTTTRSLQLPLGHSAAPQSKSTNPAILPPASAVRLRQVGFPLNRSYRGDMPSREG